MNPKYPLYIVSKGRWETRHTSKALTDMKVPHHIVIEEQEYEAYKAAVSEYCTPVILDKTFQDEYDTCDDLGDTKSKGPGPARNFIWAHSKANGHAYHWVMDDNIMRFLRYHNNRQIPVSDGTVFRCMEDFCERYTNVNMAGPNYFMFVPRKKSDQPPFVMNTRIYSCNFIKNDQPFRWRGRYNEDTILSLDMLKAGFCTIQFNAFLQLKLTTQAVKGGNTGEFYAKEGTLHKSAMQVQVHPDVSRMMHRFGRIHHYVDYTPFKNNRLKKRDDLVIPEGPNEYGMAIVDHVEK